MLETSRHNFGVSDLRAPEELDDKMLDLAFSAKVEITLTILYKKMIGARRNFDLKFCETFLFRKILPASQLKHKKNQTELTFF